MEQQMVVFQNQVMELQAAKSDDDRKAAYEKEELMDQKGGKTPHVTVLLVRG